MWHEQIQGGVRILSHVDGLDTNSKVTQALQLLEAHVLQDPGGRWAGDAAPIALMNSEAIGKQIAVVRRVSAANGRMVLVNPTRHVRGVLQTLRLVKLLPIVDDVEQAVARLA
ncbi:MAG: hypothetical protein H0W72_10070 [Planctomycetes bacterium]|nr:hypothetical protein [Planctomycetota bacterium]